MGEGALYGFGRSKYDAGNPKAVHAGHVGLVKDGYQQIGRIDHAMNPHRLFAAAKAPVKKGRSRAVAYKWRKPVPMLVRAMLVAGRPLFIAGPRAGENNSGLMALGADGSGLLWAVSAEDGSVLAEHEVASVPVLDGMAATRGRVFISTIGGNVICMAGEARE